MRGLLFGLWLVAVALATLKPTELTPPLTVTGFLCLGCGWGDTADMLVNLALFLPGGALAATLWGHRRAVFGAFLLSLLVETLQIGLPGRDPALQDIVFNTLGAACGAWVVRHGLSPRWKALLAVGAAVAWLSPIALLRPLSTPSNLFGQWNPAFRGFEAYSGRERRFGKTSAQLEES